MTPLAVGRGRVERLWVPLAAPGLVEPEDPEARLMVNFLYVLGRPMVHEEAERPQLSGATAPPMREPM